MRPYLAGLALAGALIAPAAASATTIHSFPAEGRSDGAVYVEGDSDDNRVVVDRDQRTREIVITARHLDAGEHCRIVAPGRGKCDPRSTLIVFTKGGEDRITLAPTLGRTDNELIGGPAADEVHGSPYGDFIAGGVGSDRLFGGAGNDVISGETGNFVFPRNPGDNLLVGGPGDDELGYRFDTGVDRFLAGPGADKVNSQDRGADEKISLGSGADRCRIDAVDPKPSSCEKPRVIRRDRDA